MENETRQKILSLLDRTEFYDDEGEWRIAGSDWLLTSGATLRIWAKVTEQILGSGMRVIMFKVGQQAGEQFAKSLIKEGLKNEELKYALEIFLTRGGWGKVRAKVNVQKQRAVVRIRNLVTTRQTRAKRPICHFITGYIAGVIGVMLKKNVQCTETKCRAKGDGFCEFQVVAS